MTTIGTFPLSGTSTVSGSVVSPRNNVTVTTINNNNNNKPRPKKPKAKPQPKAKVIKFHEYKGPPNVVKSSQPVSSTVVPTAVNVSNPVHALAQGSNPDNTPYHILLQQQQLYLQWQLEFSQKNRNTVQTVLLPAQKESPACSSVAPPAVSTPTAMNASVSNSDLSTVTVTTQTAPQTVFTVTPSSQHGQPPTPIQQIQISSPVLQIQQEAPVGQPQPQLNPNITPVPNKQVLKRPQPVTNGPPKQYNSLEEMKVAELKAELKKRNLPVSGPKPQLIDRLKPYADSIIKNYIEKSPSGSVTSPGNSSVSVLSPTGSVKMASSPISFSVTSTQSSVLSPQSVVMNSKTYVISTPGISSSSMTVPVAIVTSSAMFSPPGSVQSSAGSVSSPGSVHSISNVPLTSPNSGVSRPNSVLSRQGSVMSPLGSVIDETLTTNAVSPLPSIQSMQSAVSVSNMNLIPDDLSNPFSPPQSPLFIDSVMTPLSPDLMEIPVSSPQDQNSVPVSKPQGYQISSQSIPDLVQHQTVNQMEQSRPPSVLSMAPSEVEKMDVDLDLTQSLNASMNVAESGILNVCQSTPPPPPPPLPQTLTKVNLTGQSKEVQQHLLQQIQFQLQRLQERQHQQQQQKEQAQQMSAQLSQEELLRQQQEKIEKLQTQLEESQLRLQLQQLQHQQLQQQQQQLQQLQQQQQHLQQQNLQKQVALQQQQQDREHALKAPPQQQQQHQQQSLSSQQALSPTSTHQQQATVKNVTTVVPMSVPAQSVTGQGNSTHVQNVKPSPPVLAKQIPSSTATAPVVFNLPNGNKPPTFTNLPPNMKQIQIPAHLIQAVQNQQGLHTVIVAQNPKMIPNKGKTTNADFIKSQPTNQTLDLGGGKSVMAVTNTQTGAQQFIITAAPPHKPGTSMASLNGMTQSTAQQKM